MPKAEYVVHWRVLWTDDKYFQYTLVVTPLPPSESSTAGASPQVHSDRE